jgi:CxxC-x17-CxxC domain-containing protein
MSDDSIQIACVQCGQTFEVTQREREHYERRGLSFPPKRCRACREGRARRPEAPSPRFPTGDPNEYRSPMACAVPDPAPVPARRRPVARADASEYRSPAFRDSEPQFSRGYWRQRGNGPAQEGAAPPPHRARPRPMFTATCATCGGTAHVPFEPAPSRPVLCKTCFDARRAGGSGPADPTAK